MHRRYNRWHSRFDQPDPYGGSYDIADPQSFNRYAYVQNDPVNLVDPTGLDPHDPPPTNHIDPATGLPYPGGVPGINGGTVTITSSTGNGPLGTSGGGRIFGDTHFVPEDGPTGGEGPENGGRGLFTPLSLEHSDEKKKKCKALEDKINALRDELAKRHDELLEDRYNLPPTGKMSVKSHQDHFRNVQKGLRNALHEHKAQGCGGGGGLPSDGWRYATMPAPSPRAKSVPIPRVPLPVRPSIPVVIPPLFIIKCVLLNICGERRQA